MSSNKEWKNKIERIRIKNVKHYDKFLRHTIRYLDSKNIKSTDELSKEINEKLGIDDTMFDENRPSKMISEEDLENIYKMIMKYLEDNMSEEMIDDMINLFKKQLASERIGFMVETNKPFSRFAQAVYKFCRMPRMRTTLTKSDAIGTRVAIIKNVLTDQLEFVNIAKDYITIRDAGKILKHIINQNGRSGKIGGKAAGIILASHILKRKKKHLSGEVKVPKTYFMRSNVILDFVRKNGLEECFSIKYRDLDTIQKEYPIWQKTFKGSKFPSYIVSRIKSMLLDFSDVPIIVRSSSLLEDRLGTAFSGKYKSLFLANIGTLEEKTDAVLDAIAEVYASVFGPDPIMYRKERDLIHFQEEMGIIIQQVIGKKVGKYYLPAFAGVAFSNNEFRWSSEIKRDDGVLRLVAGLGTRAVDRTDDYTKLVSPGKPHLKPALRTDEIVRYSQRYIDVINLEKQKFETIPFLDLLKEVGDDYPALNKVVSILKDNFIRPPVGMMFNFDPNDCIVTFDGLIENTNFAKLMKEIIDILKTTYKTPVDIEFAHDGDDLYILQCRPQAQAEEFERVQIPTNINKEDKIFTANKYVQTAQIMNIEYVVYVDPIEYDKVDSYDKLVELGKVVSRLNGLLPKRKFILMGPGRWGSRGDIKLGVRVNYSDINNSIMLVEIARKKGGVVPDVSFGTHFFQDLVEAKIHCLPLYPDDNNVIFNEEFLKNSENSLTKFLPDYSNFENLIKLINIKDVTNGGLLNIIMDGEQDNALAYIDRNNNDSK
jgi:pyruvate, water dikinase